MSKDIYLNKNDLSRQFQKNKEKIYTKSKMTRANELKEHLELNQMAIVLKRQLATYDKTLQQLYNYAIPYLIEKGIFCHVKDKKFVIKSLPTFRRYLSNCGAQEFKSNLNDRRALIRELFKIISPDKVKPFIEAENFVSENIFLYDIWRIQDYINEPEKIENIKKMEKVFKKYSDI
jgi:hypothetical protein